MCEEFLLHNFQTLKQLAMVPGPFVGRYVFRQESFENLGKWPCAADSLYHNESFVSAKLG